MIFSIRDLAFEIGSLYLEGWLALAARCVCALLLFAAGALVSLLLRRKLFPILQARSWHFAATPILLRSLDRPLERMAVRPFPRADQPAVGHHRPAQIPARGLQGRDELSVLRGSVSGLGCG